MRTFTVVTYGYSAGRWRYRDVHEVEAETLQRAYRSVRDGLHEAAYDMPALLARNVYKRRAFVLDPIDGTTMATGEVLYKHKAAG